MGGGGREDPGGKKAAVKLGGCEVLCEILWTRFRWQVSSSRGPSPAAGPSFSTQKAR